MALPEIIKDIDARVKDTGDTMTGLLSANGGISLNASTKQETPNYILGIKAFADGGNIIWQSISEVQVGKANALTVSAGSPTTPVYFSGGQPIATSGIVVPGIKSASSLSTLGWGTNNNYVPDISLLAYWNGAYSGTASNLTYCYRGAFGNIVTHSNTDFMRYYDSATKITSLDVVNTPSYIHTVSTSGGAPATATKPAGMDNAWGIIHLHTHSGNYATQLGFGGTTGKMYYRNAYATSTFGPWITLFDSTGGPITGRITKAGSSSAWINGRDQAIVALTSYNAYSAAVAMKTTNGSWDMGVYTGDKMYFTYAPDTNYSAGSNTGYTQIRIEPTGVLFGAAWNDYAEYRESDITQPGRCIIENGDDTLRLSTERLQRGAEIVSDTFGFAIGETDTCKTPIAASGRVLAYGYEDREQFKSHIGYPVCSGPNGTVSIMTDEEEQLYPSRIIGYISAVPDYEIWGTGNVKVDGRIWIRIK